MFDEVDEDKNGTLDFDEMSKFMDMIRIPVSEDKRREMFN